MTDQYFSNAKRAPHLGPYRSEKLRRTNSAPDLSQMPAFKPLSFSNEADPYSIINAMRGHQAMLDAIRNGAKNKKLSDVPADLQERSAHLKSFGYFCDAAGVAICKLPNQARLSSTVENPDMESLTRDLQQRQMKSLAGGIDQIMAELRERQAQSALSMQGHDHVLVLLYENPRDPNPDEVGTDWIKDAQAHRAALLASETAVVLANYLRLLGYGARAHTASCTDLDLNKLAVAAGLLWYEDETFFHPHIGTRFGLAAISTDFKMQIDYPLAPSKEQPAIKEAKPAYAKRRFVDGAHPFEKLKRVETPTTFIDEPRVARVPKRADMFARAQFGDMGKKLQDASKGGKHVSKAAPASAQRRALGAFTHLQDGPSAAQKKQLPPKEAAALVKATCYFLGFDAVGISRCPEWAWYSHDARGVAIDPPHDQAISMIVDQGFDTMTGSSGDDWIAVAQSMRAYLRFSLLGGVVAQQIRNLGYKAKAHTVMDGEVLQPPLLLLAGLGEVSRIGEVILNPYLGPRLKSGVVSTDLPMAHDLPIDFGLQNFCESCNKCARECPSGAITAGPKKMFNGYEIWKSDSQKCTTYRVTNAGGAMCGRCMKTCPWNLEGLFQEKPFRWAAMNVPKAAPVLAKMDDWASNGGLNPIKKWWWDLELSEDGAYGQPKAPVNQRDLQKDLVLKPEDQTLAVYPASLAPPPYPYPFAMDREAGIEAYQAMITAEAYKGHLREGTLAGHQHIYSVQGESPVIQVRISKREEMATGITKYEFVAVDGSDLPKWEAGAHIDVVIAPEFLRSYSLSGNPNAQGSYQIGVLRETSGRGGSDLSHRIFNEGRRLFISKPINHFACDMKAKKTILMGGGIGITPLIAMGHELFEQGRAFELHYSGRARDQMGFLSDLATFPWAKHVHLHITDEGTRGDFCEIFSSYESGYQLYTCGSEGYMSQVIHAAQQAGYPEESCHLEYFQAPEVPEYTNHPFTLRLMRSGRDILVPADQSATQALAQHGVHIDVKCSDGICGVCKCGLEAGEVEHRDFVLSNSQREKSVILCQSRAAQKDGVIEIDL